ncbi:MAG: hypothetical protein EOO45_00130 [Flavobacterium sp.]|nr:MAG: hypothetical protein EOO45_00130 [Flavobacterium sp.]
MSILASKSIDGLRKAKRALKSTLPRQFHTSPPVSQIYLNDPEKGLETSLTIVNFPSFFSPLKSHQYIFEITLCIAEGEIFWKKKYEVDRHCSREIILNELEIGIPNSMLPKLGIVSVGLKPRSPIYYGDRLLGRITPHFFVRYTSSIHDSVAVVHPQTFLNVRHVPGINWASNAILETKDLTHIFLYQMNPTKKPVQTASILIDVETDEEICRQVSDRSFASVHQTVWEASHFQDHPRISVAIENMPAENGKPIIFGFFRDKSFFAFHG